MGDIITTDDIQQGIHMLNTIMICILDDKAELIRCCCPLHLAADNAYRKINKNFARMLQFPWVLEPTDDRRLAWIKINKNLEEYGIRRW